MNEPTPTQPPTKGLRKYIPQPDRFMERYGTFALTPRDLEIVRLVYDYRHLESRHVRALIGGSDQQITRRLQGLFHNGYLARYTARQRMRPDLGKGSPLMAYGLERKGWRLLQEHAGAGEESDEDDAVRWSKDYTRRTEWFLEHAVMRSHFRTVLALGLRSSDVDEELIEWDQSDKLQVRVTPPGGRKIGLVPDAFFSLDVDGSVANFFVEFDRASEVHTRIQEKMVAYWWWLQSKAYQKDYHNHRRVKVLFVTTGERRLANMMETLRALPKPNRPAYGGKGWFQFCLEEDYPLEEPSTILGPLWRTVARPNDRQGLVE